jgi:hypothetical protein
VEDEEEQKAEKDTPILEIIASPKFYMLFIIASTHKSQGYYVGNSFKQIGFLGGLSDSTLTIIGSFGALFNGASKIILASLLDYTAFKPIYVCILSLMILSLVLMMLTTSNAILYGACVWINFLGDGSMTSMLPVVTYNIWGRTRGAEVYGYMYAEFGFAAMYGLLLVKLL